jgi:large subunit ribosomal protein LX
LTTFNSDQVTHIFNQLCDAVFTGSKWSTMEDETMEVKQYVISGSFSKKNTHQRFSDTVRAIRKEDAIEKVVSEIGGRFKVKRAKIKIEKVEEAKPKE